VLLVFTAAAPLLASAQGLEEALAVKDEARRDAVAAQARIDALDDATREALLAYRAVTEETEALRRYNAQLERLVASQAENLTSLERQIDEIEVTKRRVFPLLDRMLGVLAEFVELDKPFLLQERALRVAALEAERDRADVSLADKFRRLLEAYQIEAEYGRTISADRATLELEGGATTVDVLRFGRVGLYYLTLDRRSAGVWDAAENAWQPLADEYRHAVSEGLAMARREKPPALVRLPVTFGGPAGGPRP